MDYKAFFIGVGVGLIGYIIVTVLFLRRAVQEAPSPWEIQAKLMRMSDQKMPALPQVNNDTLLYFALMMEELGETGRALCNVLQRTSFADALAFSPKQSVVNHIDIMSSALKRKSVAIRAYLKDVGPFIIQPTEAEARELLDGTTDNAVVNCGFALASGLPGEEAYEAVGKSNHSKANPDTGVIDKTPEGKWIKGVNYQEPDLLTVLHQQEERVWLEV